MKTNLRKVALFMALVMVFISFSNALPAGVFAQSDSFNAVPTAAAFSTTSPGGLTFSYPRGNNGFEPSYYPSQGSTHHFGVVFFANVTYSDIVFQWYRNGEAFGAPIHRANVTGPAHRVGITLSNVNEADHGGAWHLTARTYVNGVATFFDRTSRNSYLWVRSGGGNNQPPNGGGNNGGNVDMTNRPGENAGWGVTFTYPNFDDRLNVNANSTVNFHVHAHITGAARDANFSELRFEWLRNGEVWQGAGGTGSIPAGDIVNPGHAGIRLQLPGAPQAQRGGVWQLRVLTIGPDGNVLFTDYTHGVFLTTRGQGGGDSTFRPPTSNPTLIMTSNGVATVRTADSGFPLNQHVQTPPGSVLRFTVTPSVGEHLHGVTATAGVVSEIQRGNGYYTFTFTMPHTNAEISLDIGAPRIALHGIEFEQEFAYDLPDLIPPFINDVDVRILRFLDGIYRVTISVDDVTLDPRSENPFFFWQSNEGTFHDIIDYRQPYAQFTFKANPGTANRNVQLIMGVGDRLGQVDRVSITLKGNDADYVPLTAEFEAFETPMFAPFAIEQAEELAQAFRTEFNPSLRTNIAFALDTSADMNTIDPALEIPTIFENLTDLAPAGTHFSVVAGSSVTSLTNADGVTATMNRITSYSGTVDTSQLLPLAASTLGGGNIQNVIVYAASAWDYSLISQAQDLEQRGFIVYLLIHESDEQMAYHLQNIHPNTIVYTEITELKEALHQLQMFDNFDSIVPLSITPFAADASQAFPFTDVADNHWARAFILNMYNRQVITGRGNNIFDPNTPATIAEFLVMTMNLAGLQQYSPAGSQWARNYIDFGLENQFFVTVFEPGISLDAAVTASNVPITREFAFYLLYRVFSEHTPETVWNRIRSAYPIFPIPEFVDASYISADYFDEINALFKIGVVTGRPNLTLAPKDAITRAEVTSLLFRMVTNVHRLRKTSTKM